jgi:hypothetical protein
MTFLGSIALTSGLIFSLPSIASEHAANEVYSSHDDWFFAQPGAVFVPADRLESMSQPIGSKGRHRLTWHVGASSSPALTVTLQGNALAIEGRRLMVARVMKFPGEAWTDLGHRASLYAHGVDLCIEGVPPTASGRAQRHVQVLWAPGALKPRRGSARPPLYQLPSLFASCAGIRRDEAGQVHVPQALYIWREGADEAVGLTWTDHVLTPAGFKATGVVQQVEFVEPGNVYRFRVLSAPTGER